MKRCVAVIGLSFALSITSSAFGQQGEPMQQEPGLGVESVIVTSQVQDRMPVDTLSEISSQLGAVFCWTRVTGVEGETTIEHVWYRGDEEMARVQLRVEGPSWRTWSSKRILPDWIGEWRVDVVGPDGTVLDSTTFQVVNGEGPGR